MNFINYDKLINNRKKELIDSYVLQYGEENRTLIEQRFESIRFCFFETPIRIRKYVDQKSLEEGKKFTLQSLQAIGMDVSTIRENEILHNFESTNPELDAILKAFFPTCGYMTLYNINDGIFGYFNATDIKKELFQQRLRNVILTDEEIRRILEVLDKYKAQFLVMFSELLEYANDLDSKIATLIEEHKKQGKESEEDIKKLYYDIAKMCIINNFNIDEFDIGIIDFRNIYHKKFILVKGLSEFLKNKNGTYVPVVYISPLDEDCEYLDVLFDHEVRHAIEYSIDGNNLKAGLSYRSINGGKTKYHRLNEVMTQMLSINSTLWRQNRGITIFPAQKTYSGMHNDYDEYVGAITSFFNNNRFLIQCRLLPSLNLLFSYCSQDELNKIDSELLLPDIQSIQKR